MCAFALHEKEERAQAGIHVLETLGLQMERGNVSIH